MTLIVGNIAPGIVHGVPDKAFEIRLPPTWRGKQVRFRFRRGEFAYVFVRDASGIRKFNVRFTDGVISPALDLGCIAMNKRVSVL